MESLGKYLERVIENCYCPITFSGDRHSIINRWLVKGRPIDGKMELDSVPLQNYEGFVSLDPAYNFLPKEILDNNWRFYYSQESDEMFQQNKPETIINSKGDMYVYALCNIYCRKQQDVYFYLNAEMPIRVWVNGNLTATNSYEYFLKPYPVICRLEKGNNTLLIEKTVLSKYKHISSQCFQIVTIPCEALEDKENCYFREDTLFADMEKAYHIIPEKSFNPVGQGIGLIVLPQYFKTYAQEKIRINLLDTKGNSISHIDTLTSEKIEFSIEDEKIVGPLKVQVSSLEDPEKNSYLYVFRGDFDQESSNLLEKVKNRRDCNTEIANIVKMLSGMFDFKSCSFKGLPEILNERFYSTLFEKYAELYEYTDSADCSQPKEMFEVFKRSALIFKESEIDDGFFAYGVFLPKNYDPGKKYALIVMGTYGYALSQYPLPVPYLRKHQYEEAIVLNICLMGEVDNDIIHETEIIKTIKHVTNTLSVDRERIFLIGVCSSSKKCLRWTLKMPDLFAGYASVFGSVGRDPLYPTWETDTERILEQLHTGKSELLSPDLGYLNNVQNMALYHLGDIEDLGENWVKDVSVLKKLDRYKSFHSHSFSHDLFDEMFCTGKLLDEIIKEKKESFPRRLEFTTYCRPYNKSYWVEIRAFERLSEKAVIKANVYEGNTIDIRTVNVKEFSILIDSEQFGFDSNEKITIAINGNKEKIDAKGCKKVMIRYEQNGLKVDVIELTLNEFMKEYNAINIDEGLTGIKQVYLNRCVIVKPDFYKENKQSFARKLFYSIQNPFKNKMRIYNYDVLPESETNKEELSSCNFIYVMDLRNLNSDQRSILKLAGVAAGDEFIEYKGTRFLGDYFAFIKCENPYVASRQALIILVNSDSVENELLKFYQSFDGNPVFYSDAVIFNNSKYHSFTD